MDSASEEPTEYSEVMWATQEPDFYAGDDCDEIEPRWHCHCEGDMDSEYIDTIEISAKHFPAGTRVLVLQPCCPECGQIAELCSTDEYCEFDWESWAAGRWS